MTIFKLLIILFFLIVPSFAYAWGPLTHTFLGNELLSLGSLLPASLLEILRRYRKDFIYGNLMADIIVGKKYLPDHKNSHNWDFAFGLLKASETRQQKAFVCGYLSHLAADTVAHNMYTVDKKNIGHTFLEMKADCIIDKKYWLQAMQIDRRIQIRNDIFLENSLERFIFSFKTNKRILKGMAFLTICYPEKVGDFLDRTLVTYLPVREKIEKLHQESLDNMIDLFQNWEKSEVVKMNPSGNICRRRFLKNNLKAFLYQPVKISDSSVLNTRKRFGIRRRIKDI